MLTLNPNVHATRALLEAVKDPCGAVRSVAFRSLKALGDEKTLPAKIVGCADMSPREQYSLLSSLRHVRGYMFPRTRELCCYLLVQPDQTPHSDARRLLNYLDRDDQLLVASDAGALDRYLMRPVGRDILDTDSLLRTAELEHGVNIARRRRRRRKVS